MVTLPECPITELDQDWCAHCKGLLTPEEEAAKESSSFDDWLDSLA